MTRELLPNRREAEAMDFTFRGAPYRVCAGFFPDGRLAEIFVDRCDKSGNDSGDDAKDASVAVSLALQHGTPVETIRHAVSRTREGEPLGLIGAVLDLLALPCSEASGEMDKFERLGDAARVIANVKGRERP